VYQIALVIAVVRSTETWSAGSIAAGLLLLGAAAAALAAWVIRVVGRR
jgi:hypothetical protein